MEKLLIIGAGIGQVPLLKKAQARGVHVLFNCGAEAPCYIFKGLEEIILP